MKKLAILVLATLGVTLSGTAAMADWGTLHYGGYQPKWAFWNRHGSQGGCGNNCEEERWQQFWHDYYDALQHYYDRLDNIDWVTYYKFHGYQLNNGGAGCGPYGNPYCRPQFAPVFVSPSIQWAVPQSSLPNGNGCPPNGCQPNCCPPNYCPPACPPGYGAQGYGPPAGHAGHGHHGGPVAPYGPGY